MRITIDFPLPCPVVARGVFNFALLRKRIDHVLSPHVLLHLIEVSIRIFYIVAWVNDERHPNTNLAKKWGLIFRHHSYSTFVSNLGVPIIVSVHMPDFFALL